MIIFPGAIVLFLTWYK